MAGATTVILTSASSKARMTAFDISCMPALTDLVPSRMSVRLVVNVLEKVDDRLLNAALVRRPDASTLASPAATSGYSPFNF